MIQSESDENTRRIPLLQMDHQQSQEHELKEAARMSEISSHQITLTQAATPSDLDVAPQQAVPHRGKLHVLGPNGLYSPPTSGPIARFLHLFPDTRTRIAGIVFLIIACGLILAWSIVTIQSKWIKPMSSPFTSLTIESVNTLPAQYGLTALMYIDTWYNRTIQDTFGHDTLLNISQIPINNAFPTYTIPAPVPDHEYIWQRFVMLGGDEQIDNQTAIKEAYTCEFELPTGLSGIQITPVSYCTAKNYAQIYEQALPWPLEYRSTLGVFCMRTYRLFDKRATVSVDFDPVEQYSFTFNQFQFDLPNFRLATISLTDLYKLYSNYIATDATVQNVPSSLYSYPLNLPFNTQHDVTVRMNKRVALDGTVTYHSELNVEAMRSFNQSKIASYFDKFYRDNPDVYEMLKNDPNVELDLSQWNATSQYFAETCIGPATFDIQVVTESTNYGIASFLSDLGGALNIITLTLSFLFPLTYTFVQPRTFLLIWLQRHWQRLCYGNAVDPVVTTKEIEREEEEANAPTYKPESHRTTTTTNLTDGRLDSTSTGAI